MFDNEEDKIAAEAAAKAAEEAAAAAKAAEEAAKGGDPPNPMDVILAKFEELNTKVTALSTPAKPEEKKEEDPTFGFDPQKIVAASGNAAVQAVTALRKAEADIRKTFGADIDDASVEDIISRLAGLAPQQLIDSVNAQGHMAMGYAHLGVAYKEGKFKQKEAPKTKATPIGQETPTDTTEGSVMSEFEKLYGPVKKTYRDRQGNSMRDRLTGAARGY